MCESVYICVSVCMGEGALGEGCVSVLLVFRFNDSRWISILFFSTYLSKV